MYAYDFVKLYAQAARVTGDASGIAIIGALNRVSIQGANGDSRSFNENNHEGVVDDDVYFAKFHGMVFDPVNDDALSATLDKIPQTY
jgi:hypothetical protein